MGRLNKHGVCPLKDMADFSVEFGIDKSVPRVRYTKGVCQKGLSGWTFSRIPESLLISFPGQITCKGEEEEGLETYTVKQSYMNPRAAGLMFMDTSSGIGGAWFKLPSLKIAPIASSLLHGRRPANISRTTHPRDQMSTLALYP